MLRRVLRAPAARFAATLAVLGLLLLVVTSVWPGALGRLVTVEGSAMVGTASFDATPVGGEAAPSPVGSRTSGEEVLGPPPARPDDVLPARFYARNREAVLDALPSEAVAVFFSSPQRTRSGDIRHRYRQNSNLRHLTGATEPATALMLVPGGIEVDGEAVREVLFVPPRTAYSDAWLGPRLGPAEAARVLGVEKTLSSERFSEVLRQSAAAGGSERRFFHLPLPYGIEEDSELAKQVAAFRGVARLMPEADSPLTRRAAEVMRTVDRPAAFRTYQQQFRERLDEDAFQTAFLRGAYRQFATAASLSDWDRWRAAHFGPARADGQALERLLAGMRQRKTSEEQRLVHRAAQITAEAQTAALRAVEPDLHEYAVAARAEYVFGKSGAEAPAFPSLVASGPNTAVLQYHHNRRRMQAGDLVVVDLGAEYHGYAADVARTAPVDGTFSAEQRAIYDLVLDAQRAAIRAARAGNNFRDPHQVARQVLGEGLVELGLLDAPNEVGQYFTHPAAHYLGRDVHDTGHGGPLQTGTVLTVGAGLYLRPSADLPEKWHDVGVRIEDVVVVTRDGPVVLSDEAPRDPEAVEALVRERRES